MFNQYNYSQDVRNWVRKNGKKIYLCKLEIPNSFKRGNINETIQHRKKTNSTINF